MVVQGDWISTPLSLWLCLKASCGVHRVMPPIIMWSSQGDASRHHVEFTEWCLQSSCGVHRVMPPGIMWSSQGDASRHHVEFTGWCLQASCGVHRVMPPGHHVEFTGWCLQASCGVHRVMPPSIISKELVIMSSRWFCLLLLFHLWTE